MITLLSPAKNLDFTPAATAPKATTPIFSKEIKELSDVTRQLSRTDLSQLMGISDKLSDLNYQRFQAFKATRPKDAKQAVLSFNGDVYQGLEARTMDDKDHAFAQDHLRILSGLYGLLRPLDAIQPYRLEMGTRLKSARGATLYDFWGEQLAKQLDKELKSHTDRTVVNLASNEYFKAVSQKALSAPVVTPVFKEEKDGQARIIGLFAKKARGLMARWIIDNRIEQASMLSDFTIAGYRYKKSLSDERQLVFVRKQPAKKAA